MNVTDATGLFPGSTIDEMKTKAGAELFTLGDWSMNHPEVFEKQISFRSWIRMLEVIKTLALTLSSRQEEFLQHFAPAAVQDRIEVEALTQPAMVAVAADNLRRDWYNENQREICS